MSDPVSVPRELVERIDRALTRAITVAIALGDSTPYEDDPRWSPWTRYHAPVAERCEAARKALRELAGAP
ncbi:MAG: hypothetical protein WKF96_24740 [Solirubrobacteraceae bacterium]